MSITMSCSELEYAEQKSVDGTRHKTDFAQQHEVIRIACQACPLAKKSSICLHCPQRFAAFLHTPPH